MGAPELFYTPTARATREDFYDEDILRLLKS